MKDLHPIVRRLTHLERALSQIPDFEGWIIGSCQITLDQTEADCDNYTAHLTRRGGSAAVIQVSGSNIFQTGMQVLLVKPSASPPALSSTEGREADTQEGSWPLSFCRPQVDAFLEAVGDYNPIHRGAGAIVPGFLMVNRMTEYFLEYLDEPFTFSSKRLLLNARFHAPLSLEQPAWGHICQSSPLSWRCTLSASSGPCLALDISKA